MLAVAADTDLAEVRSGRGVIDQNGNIVGDPIVGAISSAEQRAALDKLIDQAIANSEQ